MKPLNLGRMVMLRIYQASGLRLDNMMFSLDYPEVDSPLDGGAWVKVHWMEERIWFNSVARVKMPLYLFFNPRRVTLVPTAPARGELNG